MSAAEGVPAWARPVLEALREVHAPRSMAEAIEDNGRASRAVYDACRAALASDAGTPGCICGEINARHCPVHQDAGTPEGEIGDLLDRMLAAHGAALSPTSISREERCALGDRRDALKDEVLSLYRAATGEVIATGSIVNIWQHLGSVEVKVDRLPEPGTPVSLVRWRDKEGA